MIDLCTICFPQKNKHHLLLLPPTLLQCFRDNPLELTVDGAELVGSPSLHGLHGLRVDAEQEGLVARAIVFFLGHRYLPCVFTFAIISIVSSSVAQLR